MSSKWPAPSTSVHATVSPARSASIRKSSPKRRRAQRRLSSRSPNVGEPLEASFRWGRLPVALGHVPGGTPEELRRHIPTDALPEGSREVVNAGERDDPCQRKRRRGEKRACFRKLVARRELDALKTRARSYLPRCLTRMLRNWTFIGAPVCSCSASRPLARAILSLSVSSLITTLLIF
jgi:hypothetical protein